MSLFYCSSSDSRQSLVRPLDNSDSLYAHFPLTATSTSIGLVPSLSPSSSFLHHSQECILMSQRVTRSAARLAAETSSTGSETPPLATSPQPKPTPARKRKASLLDAPTHDDRASLKLKRARTGIETAHPHSTSPVNGKARGGKTKPANMSSEGYDDAEQARHLHHSRRRSTEHSSGETSPQNIAGGNTKRRSTRKKAQGWSEDK